MKSIGFTVAVLALSAAAGCQKESAEPISFETATASYVIEQRENGINISATIKNYSSLLEKSLQDTWGAHLPEDRCGTSLAPIEIKFAQSPAAGSTVVGKANWISFQCANIKIPVVTCKDVWITLPFGGKTKGLPRCSETFENREERLKLMEKIIDFEYPTANFISRNFEIQKAELHIETMLFMNTRSAFIEARKQLFTQIIDFVKNDLMRFDIFTSENYSATVMDDSDDFSSAQLYANLPELTMDFTKLRRNILAASESAQ